MMRSSLECRLPVFFKKPVFPSFFGPIPLSPLTEYDLLIMLTEVLVGLSQDQLFGKELSLKEKLR